MKRLYRFWGVAVVMTTIFTACSEDINLPYTDNEKVYFEYEYQDPAWTSTHLVRRDSVVAAMGKLPSGVTQYEVKVPVKVLGAQLLQDKTYRVEVVDEGTVIKGKTTAVEGVHYLPLPESHTFHAGTWTDTLRFTVLRSALSTSYVNRENRTLVLRISDAGELKPGLRDGWEMLVSLSNYISEPSWWTVWGLGFYHPEKYKILLMFADEQFYATTDLLNDSAGKRCVSAMRNYLRDNVVLDEETGKRVTFDSLVDIEEE